MREREAEREREREREREIEEAEWRGSLRGIDYKGPSVADEEKIKN